MIGQSGIHQRLQRGKFTLLLAQRSALLVAAGYRLLVGAFGIAVALLPLLTLHLEGVGTLVGFFQAGLVFGVLVL